ncbi:MAG: DUF4352 domain-containing protein [Caldisericia bacterium]|nr:DUF4352 domain-containing protein [Caldisericia bacterium]
MKRIISAALLMVLIPMMAVACGGDVKVTPDNGGSKLPDPEFANLGEWAVKVDSQSVVKSIMVTGQEKTEEGYVFVKVDITARNNMDQDSMFMLGMLTPELDDGKGNISQYELFVDGALDKVDCKAGETVSGSIYFKMPGDMNLVTAGMKLNMTHIGQREQPKAEIILK